MKQSFFALIILFSIALDVSANCERLVRPFYAQKTNYSFNLEFNQSVSDNNGNNYCLKWYRDTEEWHQQDETYSKLEIIQEERTIATYINEVGWVKFNDSSNNPSIAETFSMNDSIVILLLKGRTYSAGYPELCLIKLVNGTADVIYCQEQIITDIHNQSNVKELSLEGYVINCQNYEWNVSHSKMTGNYPKLKLSQRRIIVEDENGPTYTIFELPSFRNVSLNSFTYRLNLDTNEATVVKWTNNEMSCTIPSQIISEGETFTVVSIGDSAFYNCAQLARIIIPSSVNHIGQYAFKGTSLKIVQCSAIQPPVCITNAFTGIDLSKCLLNVDNAAIEDYKRVAPWNAFLIPEAPNGQ